MGEFVGKWDWILHSPSKKTEDMVADTVSNLFTTFLLLAFSVNIFSRDVMDRMVCGQKLCSFRFFEMKFADETSNDFLLSVPSLKFPIISSM